MKNSLFSLLTVFLVFITGCGSQKEQGIVQEEPNVITKEIDIFDTKYIIQDDWTVIDMNDDSMKMLIFQSEMSDKINTGLIISVSRGALEGATKWNQAEWYLQQLKEAMINQNHINKDCSEQWLNKKETPVLMLSGKLPSDNNVIVHMYLLFNDFEDPLILEYRHATDSGDKDYSEEVRELVNSMVLSFDGFDKVTSTSSNTSNNNGCDGEPYSIGSDWVKYDKNGDGCINDAEFQAGMGDAAENRLNGSSSGSSTSNRNGLCEFKENGRYVCNKKAMSGMSYCQEHWDLLKSTYDNLTGN